MANIQNRFKSPILWSAIAGLVIILANAYDLWYLIGVDESQFREIIGAVGAVAIALGIINNPSDADKV